MGSTSPWLAETMFLVNSGFTRRRFVRVELGIRHTGVLDYRRSHLGSNVRGSRSGLGDFGINTRRTSYGGELSCGFDQIVQLGS